MTEANDQLDLTGPSEAYFADKFKPMRSLYIDLEAIQDFRLGALLNLISTEEEYLHIQQQIPLDYEERIDDVTMKYFPAITSVTDVMINEYIKNPTNHRAVIAASPMTLSYALLPELIGQIHKGNSKSAETNKTLELTIGTNSVIYDKAAKDSLIADMHSFCPSVKITILNRSLAGMEEERYASFSLYLIYDMKLFFKEPKIAALFTEDAAFQSAYILALPLLETDLEGTETEAELLTNTQIALNMYCEFGYTARGIYRLDESIE